MPVGTAYILGSARHFPAPYFERGRMKLWLRADVEAFFAKHPRPEMKKKAKKS